MISVLLLTALIAFLPPAMTGATLHAGSPETATKFSDSSGNEPVRLLSPVAPNDPAVEEWNTEFWSDEEHYSLQESDRSDFMALVIDADSLTHSRWYRNLLLKPYSRYRVTGWIRTENVSPESEGGGAGFRFGNLDFTGDRIFTGDNDWTFVEMEFDTGGEDSAMLEGVLGKETNAEGRVYFDELRIGLISSEELAPQASIDPGQTGEPMTEYIYGQFIEHLGNCIYGGIWAEMIEDRKFFYEPGHEESPWIITGEPSAVVMDSVDSWVGDHSPVIRNDGQGKAGLMQDSLGFREDMTYEGRLILSAEPGALPLKVSIVWGEEAGESDEILIDDLETGDDYQTVPLEFLAGKTTKGGRLKIINEGNGAVRIGTLSLMPADNIDGFRADVLALMKKLDSPVYRWPGGNFVSGYNWKDGVGERDKRPPRYERAWGDIEPNDVGIHEFMRLVEILGADANIAVNTGLGTPEEAAEQVEYVNGAPDTPMGAWRAENGRAEPYNVTLWAVGNEMFGDWQLGVMPVEEYVEKHNETARLMWEVDPDIELIAVGFPGEWNEMMYTHTLDYMDHISEHFYRQDWHAGGLMTHVKQMPDAIREIAEEHRYWREQMPEVAEREINISLDEWNYWYGPHIYGALGTRYFLQDALGIAAGLNELLRQSDIFMMANYAQTVNAIGAIKATSIDAFMEGTGEVLKVYRREFGTVPVAISGNTAPLDVAPSLTKDGRYLTISIVNPTKEKQHIELEFESGSVPDSGELFYITGPDRYVYNDPGQPEIREHYRLFKRDNGFLEVPAMSAGIYKFDLR